MQRYEILHRTYYNFTTAVRLGPHGLRLRPREGHELRVESVDVRTTPASTIRWSRDVEDNSVAIATFELPAQQLMIESHVIVQQYNQAPFDFLLADQAADYPFTYALEDAAVLAPYMTGAVRSASEQAALARWVSDLWPAGKPIQTFALLQLLNAHIHQSLSYRVREDPGVQTPAETIALGTGSCRDWAFLFMEAARQFGLAARFASGYLNTPPSSANYGATHAWAEVFLPGVGWKGFDPTTGVVVGTDHIAVAVARLPESVPPIEGSFSGPPGSTLDVGVWVTPQH
ncbi:MAG: transglutaminase [Polyangiaceae bacterium]|jgi:transglutaminase-like putative cysteine protease|nr:transglutaminase [Polyangiaceae bacterium]